MWVYNISGASLAPLACRVGVELEFYLFDANYNPCQKNIVTEFISNFPRSSLLYCVELERGISQIELKFSHTKDLEKLCEEILQAKNNACKMASKQGLRAIFKAQPLLDDCGNALQINLSLHNENDENLFCVDKKLRENAIAGMLDNIDEMMVFYAPNEDDSLRYDLQRNINLHKKGKFSAPVNKSFGDDNRSCAIRVLKNRIEFRVASANCEPRAAILAVLQSVEKGILQNLKPQVEQKVYGNAFDEKYAFSPIKNRI